MDNDEIRVLLTRLARPHRSGGTVVERAAILAEGADFPMVMAWIGDHDGKPEEQASAQPRVASTVRGSTAPVRPRPAHPAVSSCLPARSS